MKHQHHLHPTQRRKERKGRKEKQDVERKSIRNIPFDYLAFPFLPFFAIFAPLR
jgi:hypothetical protein